ncbi:hypothetical protein [Amycolatopsis tucumanensis]|uniref:Secreted protein n=1 Tax=Amycolatopsis tucumanensis TaxID=401106 RepID=A0ABP7JX19_9PSEU|nr:hypothetical protein [Amycolatopsis tucumanensis]MCF6429127.1 hypothetical protein [Amycolatopsis tucumanensis]
MVPQSSLVNRYAPLRGLLLFVAAMSLLFAAVHDETVEVSASAMATVTVPVVAPADHDSPLPWHSSCEQTPAAAPVLSQAAAPNYAVGIVSNAVASGSVISCQLGRSGVTTLPAASRTVTQLQVFRI